MDCDNILFLHLSDDDLDDLDDLEGKLIVFS